MSGAERSGMRKAGTEVTASSFPNESRVVPAPAGSPRSTEVDTGNLPISSGERHPTVDDLIASIRHTLDRCAVARDSAAFARRVQAVLASEPRPSLTAFHDAEGL